jgi:hypothetical protein
MGWNTVEQSRKVVVRRKMGVVEAWRGGCYCLSGGE